jgi:hypothetical protein
VNSLDDIVFNEPADADAEAWKQQLADRMEEIVDRKRSSVQGRETTLAAYDHYLMNHYAAEQIESRVGELMPAFLKSVKNESSERETYLALKAIMLTLITSPSETAYEPVSLALKRCYSDSESFFSKAAALRCLGAALTYGGAGDAEMENVMDELLEIIESDGNAINAPDSTEVVVTALEEWGFLATFLDDLEEKTETAMEAFVEQLESSEPAVQIAAGENIALLFEKSYTDREQDDEPASEEEDEDGQPIDTSLVKRYDVYRQVNQLKHTLSQLATESSRRINKKDRKALHVNFADILNTVEYPTRGPKYQKAVDKETGEQYGNRMTVRVHKMGSMKIDKWWKLHRLQGLRRILGGGFVTHYEKNEVVFDSLP